jgi:fructose-1,6-bisphosphatase I
MADAAFLAEHLSEARPEVAAAVLAIAAVSIDLSRDISLGPLRGTLSAAVGANADGDVQTKLDVAADRAFRDALSAAPVRWYASEELGAVERLNGSAPLAVAIDPLDGSSNIDANVSVGTIFSILPAERDGEASFLRPGREQLAAGYVVYGPQTLMMLTLGAGVALFALDRDAGRFRRVERDFTIPAAASEFAINASNYRHWSPPVRAYIDDCLAGADGPRGKNFNMRWIASLVAETHRIMTRGGVFLYPADARPGYQRGRLRMVYECAPIAMLVEQAGGAATDARDRILDLEPAELHARTPFVFGSTEKVARVAAYHDLPEAEIRPLFSRRGLFTA